MNKTTKTTHASASQISRNSPSCPRLLGYCAGLQAPYDARFLPSAPRSQMPLSRRNARRSRTSLHKCGQSPRATVCPKPVVTAAMTEGCHSPMRSQHRVEDPPAWKRRQYTELAPPSPSTALAETCETPRCRCHCQKHLHDLSLVLRLEYAALATLQHIATHRNTSQHIATHRNTSQHDAMHLPEGQEVVLT